MKTAQQKEKSELQTLLQDEFSVVKCHKNAFGSKGYKLDMDKSALSQHVNKILKSNIERAVVPLSKPYLIKQTSQASLTQDQGKKLVKPT